jgi:hypothetical protein
VFMGQEGEMVDARHKRCRMVRMAIGIQRGSGREGIRAEMG